MPTHRILVSGSVQGVFFRAETKRQAELLGLTGWVRNTDDGKVEVVAQGEEEVLREFEQWARRGPRAAAVTDVTVEEVKNAEEFKDFTIVYT